MFLKMRRVSSSETSISIYQTTQCNVPKDSHIKIKIHFENNEACKKKLTRCKAVPPHTYGGAGGERMYSSYSVSTSVIYGGEWSASHPGRVLAPRKGP
jgi:hypothetical protein